MVREFKLKNEKGQEYSLMDIENFCLLTEPSGLGYSYSTEYERLGNTFIEKMRSIEQGQITGIANFKKYDNYKKLIDFVEGSESLKIAYKIPFENEAKEYLKDVNIQSVPKTQIQTNGILSETIAFDCLSLWYLETTAIYNMKAQSNEIRWNFKWDSRFANYDVRKLKIINNGHVEAPIIAEIEGPVKNPKISLYIEGELYQEVPFNIEIAEYEKLLYGTKEDVFYINKQNTDGTIESLFEEDVIDIANDNVIRLPKNKSCELRLSAKNGISNAKITIFEFYKAV